MQNISARLATFNPPPSRSRTKTTRPTWPWPADTHPRLNPQRMAEAGFFFDPSEEDDDDTCKCFICGTRLGGWDPKVDDPLEEHSRKDCAWAEMYCVLRLAAEKDEVSHTVDTADLLPNSAINTELRLTTFKDSWPHKPKKGWKPTAMAMAAAGFVYYGQTDSLDCVVCPWCNWEPADWEATDDPLAIHRKRQPNCPFFTISLASQKPETKPKPKASRATKGKRPTTIAASQAESIAYTGDIPESVPDVEDGHTGGPVKKGRKPRGTAATGTSIATATRAPKGRGKKAAMVAESEVAEEEPETQIIEEPVEEEKPKRRGVRSKKGEVDTASQASRAKAPEVEEDKAEITVVKKGRKPRTTKAKPEKKAVEVQAEEDTDMVSEAEPVLGEEEEEEESQPTPKPILAKSKSSRTSKAVLPAIPSSTVADEPSHGSRSTSSKRASQLPITSSDLMANPDPSSASTSSHARPIAGKPKSKKTTTSSNKALPALPPTSEPSLTPRSQAQPLNALAQFTNIPPTSPIPQPDVPFNLPQKGSKDNNQSFRQAMVEFFSPGGTKMSQEGEEEKWSRADLTEEEKRFTLEEFMRREVAERVGRMEKDGKEMIRLWKEQAGKARKEIEEAL